MHMLLYAKARLFVAIGCGRGVVRRHGDRRTPVGGRECPAEQASAAGQRPSLTPAVTGGCS